MCWLMPVLLEELESMLEDGRATLDAVVHPCSAILLFVEGYRGGLPATDRHALDDGDVELIGVCGEGICAGLFCISMYHKQSGVVSD